MEITYKSKKGIAMIELIFSLVIMGIVLLTAPLLIQQSIRSSNIALQQEAIAAAASQTAIILSMHWDENNTKITIGTSPVLDVNRTVTPDPLDFNGGMLNGLKGPLPGGIKVSGRITIAPGKPILIPSATMDLNDSNESNYTSYDDIDDFHNSDLGLTLFSGESTSSDIGEYVDVALNIHSNINYIEDRPVGNQFNSINIATDINETDIGVASNIKFITVNLTSNSGEDVLDKNITLQAFSCNIGTSLPQGETER